MSTFAQSQKKKEIKQCALELSKLSKIGSNRYCADCGHKPAKWVSITFGCWLCAKCAGIHRGLGVHITFIKSSTLDDWNYELLNKFESLGGNETVNKVYQAKLKKKDKISYETNEYRSIDFITQKYVEKKWMIKEPNNYKKNNNNNKRKKKKKKTEIIINDNDERKNESDVPDLLNFNQAPKTYKDDKPSDWVKFTENEGEIGISHIEDGDDMMPSLLDFNEMHNFAFSDLAKVNVQNDNNPINIHQDKDIIDIMNNNNDKAAILSMYKSDNNQVDYNHINPVGINPLSPFPDNNKNENSFRDANNYNYNYNYNPFNYINQIVGNTGCYVYSPNVSC